MKRPMPPPNPDDLLNALLKEKNTEKVARIFVSPRSGPADEYLPWEKIRFKNPPEGLTHEEWWARIRITRRQMQRKLPLADVEDRNFTFALPDRVLKALEQVTRDASGKITISEQVTNPATRDRYLVDSLIEEAINSSQLEGASTTRRVAKEMLRAGRAPRSRDERMIVNNFQAMRMIGEIKDSQLTPELICEIHRVVTDGTLDNAESSGRFQVPGEERVGVFADDGLLLHTPPPAEMLPERMERLCRFANGQLDEESYIPPVLRAITVHFMIGYDHPFEDGNGRTARALFYWSMLNQGYWLTEFVAISQILKNAPVKYAHSYLYSEDDENDLTYFHLHQLNVLQRSIENLHSYLAKKAQDVKELQRRISGAATWFNHRQLTLLEYVTKNPNASVTAQSHMSSHNIVYETARQDLIGLEAQGLLNKRRSGRAFIWSPVADLEARLHAMADH
ncbi:Fic family protein [Streptomyces chumphonensis]|uniref:Fic family protein n=1 Tax=Streptomyces chumphonensis TaxID=1214925 RepID=A0A927EZL7_9ACTN|nr:Fic family protein [Streptomyces chumphonensis]MBD3932889.1 Fic family protein [Streptomyces chumphonensis]